MNNKILKLINRTKSAGINIFESPWGAAIIAGFVYIIISLITGNLFEPSEYPYYNYQADAFLHGQTSLRQLPPSTHDLIFHNGKYFLYWSPFPAFLLLPFVAIFSVGFNDVIFTILIAAINVGLVAELLRAAGQVDFLFLNKTKRAILVFFFAFGTVHFTLAPFGKVWMTGQLIGFLCTLLAYLAAFSLKGGKAWFFTGLALAGAMLTRNHLIFTGIFPFVFLLWKERPWKKWVVIREMVLALSPLFLALVFYFLFNHLRFGNIFDSGYAYHNMSEFFRPDFERYGLFNIHYLPTNIYYQYIFYPFPINSESYMGGSLFLLSPIFFSAFFSILKPRNKIYIGALLASILVTNIPILLLMGTGWVQFGPRYTLDFTVPLLLMTAMGIEKWNAIISFFLTIISTIHYLIGTSLLRDI